MLTKSQLKILFSKYNFTPLKRFGENYLVDGNVMHNITAAAGVKKDDTILEIGPGFGALTFDLVSTGANIFAVEKDKKAFAIFKELVKDDFPNLKLFNEDILEFDIKKISRSGKIKVIGNLPYYITTPIMERLIENRAAISSALIVVQKEVADRFLASAGSKDYSSITCYIQYYTKPKYICTIKRTSFYPEPDVDSGLVRFDILDKPAVKVKDEELFFKIVRGAFNQRRKTIINSLSRKEVLDVPKEQLAKILERAGISPISRPEDLKIESFAQISNSLN